MLLLELFEKLIYASVGVHVSFLTRKEAASQQQHRLSKLFLGLRLQSKSASDQDVLSATVILF